MLTNHTNLSRHKPALTVLLLCTSLWGCTRFYSADKFVEEAKNYEAKNDDKSAMIQLKNALQKTPEHKEARVMLGDLYLKLEDGFSAENEYRKAITAGVPTAQILEKMVTAMIIERKFKQAEQETAAIASTGGSAELLTLRGDALLGVKDPAQAAKVFERALATEPNYAPALIGQGKLALANNNLAAANDDAEKAVVSHPKDSQSWLFKGQLLAFQHDIKGALSCFDTVLKLQPKSVPAYLAKANLEIQTKQYDLAQADIKAALTLRPNSLETRFAQAALDVTTNKNQDALTELAPILKNAPGYLPAILLSGIANYQLGSTTQSEDLLQKYVTEVPGNLYAQKLLVQSEIKNGKPKLALDTAETLIKDGHDQDSQLLDLAGQAALASKDFNKANSYFEHAVALTPQNAEYRTKLALDKLAMGNTAAAITELEKAISLDDKTASPKSAIILTMTYIRNNALDQALATLQPLKKQQPANPLLSNLEGIIYAKKNDLTKATLSFNEALKSKPDYFPAINNLAQLDVKDKKFAQAQERFLALLKIDKKNLNAELALADLADKQGNRKEQEKWLQQANSEHPGQAVASQGLIDFYFKTNATQKALDLARNLHSAAPDNPELLQVLAHTQRLARDWPGAIDSLTKLAALHPESSQPQRELALTYVDAKDPANAMAALKKALLIQPDDTRAALMLTDLEINNGDFAAAMQIARQVQSLDAKNSLGFVLEGNVLLGQNQLAPALKAYETAFKLKESGALVTRIHHVLVKLNKAGDANQRAEHWLSQHPEDNNVRVYYASYLVSQPASRQAGITQLLSALKTDPNNAGIMNNLAWAYYLDKNPAALDLATQAYALAGSNPQVMDTYGWILAEHGEVAKALPILQQANKLNPSDSELQGHLAATLARSGNTKAVSK